MAWQVKEQHVDLSLGRHYIVLHEPISGAEHHIAVYVGHDSCALCGHASPKTNTGDLDMKAILKKEIEALEASHAQTAAHARKHNVPILKAGK
jgi:hypothetical protein